MKQQTPFQLIGGEEGVRKLANAFYEAMDEMPQAAEVRAMHGESLEFIKEKLFEYLTEWFGGPRLYSSKTGSVCMTDPHKPYKIGPKERDQWLFCMDQALEKIGASEELKTMLKGPMFAIADAVRNQDESPEKDENIIASS